MAVDGNWNITATTPMGERKTTLTVKSAGSTLTGTQGADGNSGDRGTGRPAACRYHVTKKRLYLDQSGAVLMDSAGWC